MKVYDQAIFENLFNILFRLTFLKIWIIVREYTNHPGQSGHVSFSRVNQTWPTSRGSDDVTRGSDDVTRGREERPFSIALLRTCDALFFEDKRSVSGKRMDERFGGFLAGLCALDFWHWMYIFFLDLRICCFFFVLNLRHIIGAYCKAKNMKTNIGKIFIKTYAQTLQASISRQKLFNRNTVKISYSFTENVPRIIIKKRKTQQKITCTNEMRWINFNYLAINFKAKQYSKTL